MSTPTKLFMYCRKSTRDEEKQMLSIPAQIAELNEFARKNNLIVVRRFQEDASAKSPGRPVFNEMLRRIEAGEANGILCWALNRLARNFDDGGRIIGMLQRGMIREIRTIDRTHLPGDNVLLISMEFGIANQYVRDLSRDIQRGIREKHRNGVFSGKAPLGYFNEPKLRTIEPHPTQFAKIKKIFEQFATGEYSLTAIQREMTKVGLIGDRTKKPLHLATIGNLLRNPFYYGVFLWKDEMHQGTHVPMISKETFDQIQTALVTLAKPRKRSADKGFAFLDFITCGSCGYAVTAERHLKKSGLVFAYYRCTKKSKIVECTEKSFLRQEKLAEEVKRNIELVSLADNWKDRFLAQVEIWEKEAVDTAGELRKKLKAELDTVKGKLQRVNLAFTEGHIGIDEYKEMT